MPSFTRVSPRLACVAISGAAALLLLGPVQAAPFKLSAPPKVVMIYAASAKDGGWNESLDNARVIMEKELGYKIAVAESIPEESTALKNAIELFIRRGANIIITTSFGYSDGVLEAAKAHPDVAFLAASGTTNSANLESFYPRTYQAWYLAGMAAGSVTESKTLGMLGGFPVAPVDWDINAFALGAQAINPDIKTIALYTNSWWDPVKEGQAAASILEQKADVIANNLSSAAPFTAAEQAGKYSVGFQLDMSKLAPKGHLTSVVFHWDKFLVPTIQQIAAGTWEPSPYGAFPGLDQGVADITPLNDKVPAEAKAKIAAVRAKIIDGSFSPYQGPLLKQDGSVVVAAGSSLDDEAMWKMDYLVKGTVGGAK